MSYITNETEHKHDKSNVIDSVVLFEVDPVTRIITKTSENDVVLVKNDHNSERYRIAMPRYIDGHDMSLCDIARVHYINTGSSGFESSDIYEADDLCLLLNEGESEDEATKISFTWLVANTATKEFGRLAFAIELACSSDVVSNGYSWHSGVYSNITVSDGIHNSNTINSVYGDILQSWWEKLFIDNGGVVEENSRQKFRFWLGTQEEYDAIKPEDIIVDCLYFISDDKTFDNLEKKVDDAYNHSIKTSGNPHNVTAAQVGAYTKDETDAAIANSSTNTGLTNHINDKKNPHNVTAAQVGAYTKDEVNAIVGDISTSSNVKSYTDTKAETAEENANNYTEERLGDIPTDKNVKEYVDSHINDDENPHNVTAAQVGAYTKDETDAAIANSSTNTGLTNHINDKKNPHGVTAEQVGAYNKVYIDVAINAVDLKASNALAHKRNDENPHNVTAAQVGAYTKAEIDALMSTSKKHLLRFNKTAGQATTHGGGTYIVFDNGAAPIGNSRVFEIQVGNIFFRFSLDGQNWHTYPNTYNNYNYILRQYVPFAYNQARMISIIYANIGTTDNDQYVLILMQHGGSDGGGNDDIPLALDDDIRIRLWELADNTVQ